MVLCSEINSVRGQVPVVQLHAWMLSVLFGRKSYVIVITWFLITSFFYISPSTAEVK